MDTGDESSQRVLLGHITGISGLKGWVKVHSDTRPRENIIKYPLWWLERRGEWSAVKVLSARPQGKTIVAHLEGVDSPEEGSLLIGAKIAVPRNDMPKPAEGEYYWADLTGMLVRTVDSVEVGPVVRLFETGANDVMVVSDTRTELAGSKEILVPWLLPDVITDVDMDNRIITVDWDPDF